jgi:hypothetical protein
MRAFMALALLVLPAPAFAQTAVGPTTTIAVHRCERTQGGVVCGPVRDGAGFAAASGYTRASRLTGMPPRAHASNDPNAALTHLGRGDSPGEVQETSR